MLYLQFIPESSEPRTVPGPCHQNLVSEWIDWSAIYLVHRDRHQGEKKGKFCWSLTDRELVMECLSFVNLTIPCGLCFVPVVRCGKWDSETSSNFLMDTQPERDRAWMPVQDEWTTSSTLCLLCSPLSILFPIMSINFSYHVFFFVLTSIGLIWFSATSVPFLTASVMIWL